MKYLFGIAEVSNTVNFNKTLCLDKVLHHINVLSQQQDSSSEKETTNILSFWLQFLKLDITIIIIYIFKINSTFLRR